MFARDFLLGSISVSGEISNCTYHRSGHIYFTMKDEAAAISCVMFASARRGLAFRMKNGDRVVVTGSVDVFERDGRYQLYARKIRLEGAGVLYEKFLALKQELEEMGMFDPIYKQPIPAYVKKLGVVTAPTGAAIQDIRNISLRRNPYIQLILYPALVQGEGAVKSIVRGIETLDGLGLDCIIVGRGGGSIEDLWAFNEEEVARAIFNCRTPVISAVGHETDTTIADYVADLRAPTPSAAAELAVSDIAGILKKLELYDRRLQLGMDYHVRGARERLLSLSSKWNYLSPENKIREQKQLLERLKVRILQAEKDQVLRGRHRLQLLIQKYEGLSPLSKLNHGYAHVESDSGKTVSSVQEVEDGQMLNIYVRDGVIRSRVTGSRRMEPGSSGPAAGSAEK